VILKLVASGDLTLTTVAMLRPHLTAENHEGLLEAARNKSKRDVELQIARLAPKPDAPAMIRRLPANQAGTPKEEEALPRAAQLAGGTSPVPVLDKVGTPGYQNETACAATCANASDGPRPQVAPLASDRFLLRVTLSANAHAKLRRAQDLMRHTIPNGDPAQILEKALTVLVQQLEQTKTAKTTKPRAPSVPPKRESSSRHIPASLKRAVWARDQGRCTYVGAKGRCAEIGRLEYHHVIPFARGGAATIENITVRCRAHNEFESAAVFGPWSRPDENVGLGPDRVDKP
jgi:5-methylcytosine-specific restriction endonuclease McrA